VQVPYDLTRGSFKTIPASEETTNTQRFEADSLADDPVTCEPVCEANSLLSGKKTGNFRYYGATATIAVGGPRGRQRLGSA